MSFKKLEIVSRNKFDVMFSFKFKQDIKKKPVAMEILRMFMTMVLLLLLFFVCRRP